MGSTSGPPFRVASDDAVELLCADPPPSLSREDAIDALVARVSGNPSCQETLADVDPAWVSSPCDTPAPGTVPEPKPVAASTESCSASGSGVARSAFLA